VRVPQVPVSDTVDERGGAVKRECEALCREAGEAQTRRPAESATTCMLTPCRLCFRFRAVRFPWRE